VPDDKRRPARALVGLQDASLWLGLASACEEAERAWMGTGATYGPCEVAIDGRGPTESRIRLVEDDDGTD
jgi:hypothetical protein